MLIRAEMVQSPVGDRTIVYIESLILAQDERWRCG